MGLIVASSSCLEYKATLDKSVTTMVAAAILWLGFVSAVSSWLEGLGGRNNCSFGYSVAT